MATSQKVAPPVLATCLPRRRQQTRLGRWSLNGCLASKEVLSRLPVERRLGGANVSLAGCASASCAALINNPKNEDLCLALHISLMLAVFALMYDRGETFPCWTQVLSGCRVRVERNTSGGGGVGAGRRARRSVTPELPERCHASRAAALFCQANIRSGSLGGRRRSRLNGGPPRGSLFVLPSLAPEQGFICPGGGISVIVREAARCGVWLLPWEPNPRRRRQR